MEHARAARRPMFQEQMNKGRVVREAVIEVIGVYTVVTHSYFLLLVFL